MSQADRATARKIGAALLRGLQAIGLNAAGEILERDKSAVSRWSSGQTRMELSLTQVSELLAAMGLKVVPVEYRCVDPKVLESLQHLAREALDRPVQDFLDEDPE